MIKKITTYFHPFSKLLGASCFGLTANFIAYLDKHHVCTKYIRQIICFRYAYAGKVYKETEIVFVGNKLCMGIHGWSRPRDSSYKWDSLSGMRPRKLVTEAMVKPVGYDVHSVHTAVIINVNWWLMYVWSPGLPRVFVYILTSSDQWM